MSRVPLRDRQIQSAWLGLFTTRLRQIAHTEVQKATVNPV